VREEDALLVHEGAVRSDERIVEAENVVLPAFPDEIENVQALLRADRQTTTRSESMRQEVVFVRVLVGCNEREREKRET
jgi:hypothetical protein